MKKFRLGLIPLLCMLCSLGAYAQTIFTVDGITYHVLNGDDEVGVDKLENGSYAGDIVVPATVNYNSMTYRVTEVFFAGFCGSKDLKTVKLPNSISYIGTMAFKDCPNLTSVELPDSLTDISFDAFSNCSSLTHISIPEKITSLPNGAFENCRQLTSIKLPSNLQSIGENCFQGCEKLDTLILPNSIKNISTGAFFDCKGLSYVKLPNNKFSLGYVVFHNCANIKTLIIPNADMATRCRFSAPVGDMTNFNISIDSPEVVYCDDMGTLGFDKRGTATITVTGKDETGQPHKNVCNVVVEGYPVTIGSAGYATFSAISDYLVPDNLKAGIVTISNDKANVSYLAPNALGYPADEAVILNGKPGDYFLELPDEPTTVKKNSQNKLRSVYTNDIVKATPDNELLVLANGNNGLGFYYQMGCPDGSFVKNLKGKAYLDVSKATMMGLKSLILSDAEATGIEDVEQGNNASDVIYNLSGVRMSQSLDQLPKGVYIINGKKIMVK